MDMGAIMGLAYKDRHHAKCGRHLQISRVVFDHDGAARINPRLIEHPHERVLMRFRSISRVFDPIDAVKGRADAARLRDLFSMMPRSIGIDNPLPRQTVQNRQKVEAGGHMAEIDVMNLVQKRVGIDTMIRHQPDKGRAVIAPEICAHLPRCWLIDTQFTHDELFHPRLDLIEKPNFARIERVIQIKDPVFNVRELHAMLHSAKRLWGK